ncbi:Hemin transport system permease protein HmuU [Anaerolineales bacterium]|nr:Hemin transport system permease protein HmuU [Anaerolineales bacterium]
MTRTAWIFIGLTALFIIGSLFSLGMGAVSISPSETLAALSGNPVKASHEAILWDFRVARVLLVILCGSALASAGAAFQGLFRNPLADPYIVGASGGAALGATLAVVFGKAIPIGVAGFLGALGAVMVVYVIAETSNFGSMVSLLLAGAAMSTMLSGIVSLLLIMSNQVLHEVFAWLMGGFAGRSWSHLTQASVAAFLGLAITLPMSRALDALSAGESSAEALGLDLRRARLLIVIGASLSTAAAVSASGIIGFIGLIAPHIARRLVGASHAIVIPASMLIGSILLLLADDVARTIAAPLELPVGVFTALLGGPFFLFLLRKGVMRP